LNARQHASRQGWGAIIDLFERQLRSAREMSTKALPMGQLL